MGRSNLASGKLAFAVRWVALAVVIAGALGSSELMAQNSDDQFTFRSEVQLVTVDAAACNRRGEVLAKLRREDFRVWEDGQERPVRFLSRDDLPVAVALVLDCSGSMATHLRKLRDSAASVLSALRPDDQVAVFAFSADTTRVVDLTTDRERVADAFGQLRAGGGTNITDALYEATRYLYRNARDRRRAIILLSDDTTTRRSEHNEADVIDLAFEYEVSIYNLRYPDVTHYTWADLRTYHVVPDSVRNAIEETGGEMLDAQHSEAESLRHILINVRARYTLGFTPAGAPDAETHSIRIGLSDRFGKFGRDYSMVYRHGYRRAAPQVASK